MELEDGNRDASYGLAASGWIEARNKSADRYPVRVPPRFLLNSESPENNAQSPIFLFTFRYNCPPKPISGNLINCFLKHSCYGFGLRSLQMAGLSVLEKPVGPTINSRQAPYILLV
jgi:hypothetical protein